MKHAESLKLVPVLSDLDLNTAASSVGNSINMKGFHHCTFVVFFGTLGGDATHIKVYSGATDAATTSALTFIKLDIIGHYDMIILSKNLSPWRTSDNGLFLFDSKIKTLQVLGIREDPRRS